MGSGHIGRYNSIDFQQRPSFEQNMSIYLMSSKYRKNCELQAKHKNARQRSVLDAFSQRASKKER